MLQFLDLVIFELAPLGPQLVWLLGVPTRVSHRAARFLTVRRAGVTRLEPIG